MKLLGVDYELTGTTWQEEYQFLTPPMDWKFSQGQFNKPTGSSSISVDEAYKLLGLKKGASKEEVLKAANQLQKKIHPDMNRDVKTERLSQLVNEAKDKIIKSDFS